MKLNNLQVPTYDLDTSVEFYERFFGFKKMSEEDGETFLVRKDDEDGFLLALFPVEKGTEPLKWLHFGFIVDTIEEVREKYAALEFAGVKFGMTYLDGDDMAAFYTLDPRSGNRIEVGCYSPK